MLHVAHEGTEIVIGHEDLLKYTGRHNVIAAALSYRLLKWMFSVLSPVIPPERSRLNFRIAFDGPGIIDCLEVVTRAQSQHRIHFDPLCARPEAPSAPNGKFYFEASYGEQFCAAYPRPNIFPANFVEKVELYQEGGGTAAEQAAYLRMKDRFAARILAMPLEQLFRIWVWEEQIIDPAKLRRLTGTTGKEL
ncbi:MAG: hypothetical protein MI741_10380 [Rhodospirillales bacterium]|nr:hypothetical protein [Rhodospirillales bacterium]